MTDLLSNIRASVPSSPGAWWNVAVLVVGALAGWLTHPLVWVVAGPFRWIALLLGTAAGESGYAADAYNDEDGHPNGGSRGLLQFQDATWENLTGSLDGRDSPFLQGFYAARYVSHGLLSDWRWWAIALPVYGFGVIRVMWWRGNSSSAAEGLWAYAAERVAGSNRSFGGFLFWRGITLVPAGILTAAIVSTPLAFRRLRRA